MKEVSAFLLTYCFLSPLVIYKSKRLSPISSSVIECDFEPQLPLHCLKRYTQGKIVPVSFVLY